MPYFIVFAGVVFSILVYIGRKEIPSDIDERQMREDEKNLKKQRRK